MGTALTSIDRGHSETFRIGGYAPGESSGAGPVALALSAEPFGYAPIADAWPPAEVEQALEHIPVVHGQSTILPDAIQADASGAQDIAPDGETRDLEFSGLDDVLEGAGPDGGGSTTLAGLTSPADEAGGSSPGISMS